MGHTPVHSGHSGGPVLTRFGEVAGWAVKSVNGSLGFVRVFLALCRAKNEDYRAGEAT